MTIDYERNIDLYEVTTSEGCKLIDYYGFTWPNEGGCEDEDGNMPDYLFDEAACKMGVDDYDKGLLEHEMEMVRQYRYFLPAEKDVEEMIGKRKHLPLNKVTQDTPDGAYWCYYEEE